MVSMVNSVCSLKEYCLALSFSLISIITFRLNLPIQVNERSTAALIREALMLQASRICTLLRMVN
jgi:hypothetical protein